MEHEIGIRLRANGTVETTRGIELSGDAVDRLGNRLDGLAQRLPTVDKASREAAGGAGVLGGALRDAANDAAAMANVPAVARTALLSLTGGLGIAAAAALVLGAAYVKGGLEDKAFRQGIVLTGNAAGVTDGMLRGMARSVSAVAGTEGEAAASLARLVASGQVARGELQQISELSIRLQRVAGIAAEATEKQFEALARSPTRAAAQLNETTNFLTLALYEQIRALEKEGRTSEAAALAQKTYAAAMEQRTKELERNLGVMERGWNAVRDAAKGAWDWMLGIGRDKTLTDQIALVESQLKALDERRSQNPELTARRRAVLSEQLQGLKALEEQTRRNAETTAAAAAKERDAIAKREGERDKKPAATRDPSARLDESIQRRLALAQAELAAGDQLSQSDRFRIELLQQIDEIQGKIGTKRADELRAAVAATAQQMRAVEAQRAEAKEREALEKQFQAERESATRAAYAERDQMAQRNATLAEETAAIGLNAEALNARRQALIDGEIAQREEHLARIEGLPAYEEEAAALRQQIALLRERKDLQQGKYAAEVRDQEAKDNEKRREGLADSITDGIMDGFRDGASYYQIFLREMKAQFANTVLRPSVKFLVDQAWDGGSSGLVGNLLKLIGLGGGSGSGKVMDTGWYGGGWGIVGGVDGLAEGGKAGRGRLYEVNERGVPEVLTVGARSFLMMGKQDGYVTPPAAGAAPASAAAPGRSIVFSPTYHIDSRTDRAEVVMLVERSNQQAMARLVEMMDRGQV